MIRFAAPQWLLLLPLVGALLWWTGRQLAGMTPSRKRFVLALRAVVLGALVLALAGVQVRLVARRVCALFVVDASESVADAERPRLHAFIDRALKNAGNGDIVGIIVFGRNPLMEVVPAPLRAAPPLRARPDRSATDIAAALRLAMGLVPEGFAPRIVLFSDGNETMGDALSAALVAKSQGIPIDVVPLRTKSDRQDALVADVAMPAQVRRHQPFAAQVIVEATYGGEGVLRVDRDGVPVRKVPIRWVQGKNAVVVTLRADEPGVHRFRFVLDAGGDSELRNNIGMGLVKVAGEGRVLLAEGQPGEGAALAKALRTNGLKVTVVGQGGLPTRPEEWGNYEAVILVGYPAWAMSDKQMTTLSSWVQDSGIGLVMVGGEGSFLSGGYYGTDIAKVLPVDLEGRQRRVYPAATVLIVMDTSGSMAVMEGGVQKVHLAAQAAIETLRMLRPIDRFGVIVSGEGADWLVPIQDARRRDTIITQIQRIQAGGGGIYCRPSLELAAKAITAEVTRVRHIIFMGDTDDCDEQGGCFEIAQALRRMGVTITAVGFGRPNGKDAPFLQRLAQLGGGNFYIAQSARDLPKMFTADVSVMTRSAIEEHPFIPRLAGSDEMLNGIDFRSMPPLFGYCVTSDKPFARTLMRTDKGDPLLAVGQFGLGSSVAFTSDASGRWGRAWLGWGEFGKLWANIVKSALRKAAHGNYDLWVQVAKGRATIELFAADERGEPVNLLQPQAIVSGPSGESKTVVLQQEGVGRYRGTVAAGETGIYRVTVTERDASGQMGVYVASFAVPYPTEYRFVRPNERLLRQLSAITGGRFGVPPEAVFALPRQRQGAIVDLWQGCLVAALMALLLDIAARRLAIGIPEFVAAFVRRWDAWRQQRRVRPVPVTERTQRLLSAKQRAQRQPAPSGSTELPKRQAPTECPVTAQPRSPSDRRSAQVTERLLDIKRRYRQ
ncbi:hypothetical protein HRbin17_02248 [bacterium HR17]|uniref:VWFA domain-containing protein n=1 Tax=Candidatus Fervidibacter japonicus TaxID=2035412 RepID=A0A2H5XEZ9_9BACT|nr:hypothetical protein HRbin17_02248 [bacterium HR17]